MFSPNAIYTIVCKNYYNIKETLGLNISTISKVALPNIKDQDNTGTKNQNF